MIARIPVVFLATAFLGCEGSMVEPAAPEIYSLKVMIGTTGPGVDADGYSLVVDGVDYRVASQDTLAFGRFSQGEHQVQLTGLSPNCRLPAPPAPPSFFTMPPADEALQETRRVVLVGHDTGTTFLVTCYETGSLTLTLLAPEVNHGDQYRVRLSHHPMVYTMRADGTITIPWVSEGAHRVSAQGVPSCFPGPARSVNVAVSAGSVSIDTLHVGVACIAP